MYWLEIAPPVRGFPQLHARGATLIVTPCCPSAIRSSSKRNGNDRFSGYVAAWEPPTCSYLPVVTGFLRPAAPEGVLRRHYPTGLPLCSGSLSVAVLILFSFNAGQTLFRLRIQDTSRLRKCQHELRAGCAVSLSGRQQADANGEAHQLGDIAQPQFFHHVCAMCLHRFDADD